MEYLLLLVLGTALIVTGIINIRAKSPRCNAPGAFPWFLQSGAAARIPFRFASLPARQHRLSLSPFQASMLVMAAGSSSASSSSSVSSPLLRTSSRMGRRVASASRAREQAAL